MPRRAKDQIGNSKLVVSTKLPPELAEIFYSAMERDGMSASELLRVIVHQWAYGGQPGAQEGYQQARLLAMHILRRMVIRLGQELPDNIEDAIALINEGE